MSESLDIAVSKPDRQGKRMVAVVYGHRQHRDTFDTDNAFARSKWRDTVVDKFHLPQDAHEWLEAELLAKSDDADNKASEGKPIIQSMASIKTERTVWLWPGYLPAGALAIIDGDPGLGKSQLTCWLAAAISSGKPMPDGVASGLSGPRGVLLLSAEDDPSRTIRPRLEAVGADLSRVHLFAGIESFEGEERSFILPRDVPMLEQAIIEHDAALVVIDPFVSYLDGSLSMNNDANIRQALKPLTAMAERTGATVLFLRHLNKKQGSSALYRGGGSIGIVGACGAAYIVAKSQDDPESRIFVGTKMNLAKMPPAIGFSIEQHRTPQNDATSRVVWGDVLDNLTADDLLGQPTDSGDSKLSRAKAILTEELTSGSRPESEVLAACEAEGISKATYRRARKELDVQSSKPNFGEGWYLSLPNSESCTWEPMPLATQSATNEAEQTDAF